MANSDSNGTSLRARILAGDILIGTFVNMGSATSAEICARSGFDWVIIDLEHGLGGEDLLIDQLRAVESARGAAAIVRVEANSRLRCSRALDQGAEGIMVPRVESAEEAAQAVAFLRYPPAGERGVALSVRSSGYGGLSHEEMVRRNDTVAGLIQIETAPGLREVRAIAAVDGVDLLFVGPSDLTHAMGIPGDRAHPDFQAALVEVAAAARATGTACGIMVQTADELDFHIELGFTFFVIGSDSGLLANASRTLTAEIATRLGARSSRHAGVDGARLGA